jgi:RNA polymerase sigma factor (sigma-70 family)
MKPWTCRRRSFSESSGRSPVSAASRLSGPGSTASSSIRPATGSAGGGVVIVRARFSLDEHLKQFGDVESKGDVLPDRLLASKETSTLIWQALDRLPFDQRTALILREVDGLHYDEIAFSLGVAVGTVKSRLTRARQALRAELLGLHA